MSKRKKTSQRRPKPGLRHITTRVTAEQATRIEEFLDAGSYDEAHNLALELEEKYPTDELVLKILVDTALKTRDDLAMERAAVRLQRSNPRDPMILISLGLAYIANLRPALALRTGEAFLKVSADANDASVVQSQIEELRPIVAECLKDGDFDDLMQLEAHEEALSLMSIGDFSAARRCAMSPLARFPHFVPALNDVSMICIAENDYKSGADAAMKALDIDSQNIRALADLVECNRYLGNLEAARDYAYRTKSSPAAARNRRLSIAGALMWVGDYDGILETIDVPAEEDENEDTQALLAHFAAVAAGRSGYEDRARELWKLALELDPDLFIAKINLDDLESPVGERLGPTPLTGQGVLPARLYDAIRATAYLTYGASPDAKARAYRKLVRQHPELPTVANIVFDLGDPISILALLAVAKRSADPALLSEVRRFALGKRSNDDIRLSALLIVQEFDPLEVDQVRVWLKGEWCDIDPLNIEDYGRPWHGVRSGRPLGAMSRFVLANNNAA